MKNKCIIYIATYRKYIVIYIMYIYKYRYI